jgi:hypothetical protein
MYKNKILEQRKLIKNLECIAMGTNFMDTNLFIVPHKLQKNYHKKYQKMLKC